MTPREQYMTWMRGWVDGAGARAKRENFLAHKNSDVGSLYEDAYASGLRARGDAAQMASRRLGYQPNILRATDQSRQPPSEKENGNG